MIKKAILILFLGVWFFPGVAQDKKPTGDAPKNRNISLEVSGGYAHPLGLYTGKDTANPKSGFALGGWLTQIGLDWKGGHGFGLAVHYTYQHNEMKEAKKAVYQNGGSLVATGAWTNHYLMIGPVFMKAYNGLQLNFKIMGGLVISSCSMYDTPDRTDTIGYSSHNNIATGFAYQVSAGVGYAFSPHWSVMFDLKLLAGRPGVSRTENVMYYIEELDPYGNPYQKPVYSKVDYEIKKSVTTLNPSIGLIYSF